MSRWHLLSRDGAESWWQLAADRMQRLLSAKPNLVPHHPEISPTIDVLVGRHGRGAKSMQTEH